LLAGHLRVHFVADHFLFLGRTITREVFGPRLSRGGGKSSAGPGAFLKQSVFFVTLGDKHKHFMVCCSNQMSIGQLLADVRAKVCLFRFL
jgi:hypothetical protein